MPILSDAGIRAALASGDLSIHPFRETQLTPNGYDLSIGEAWLSEENRKVGAGTLEIPGKAHLLVATEEVLTLGPRHCADLWLRSSWARRGIMATFGKVDAGFRGSLTLSCFNASSSPLRLQIGETFVQIVFQDLSSEAEKPYQERGGLYQDQRGVTLSRSNVSVP